MKTQHTDTRRGRPPATTKIDPKTVYWARVHGNTWDQVATACGISRSTAIKLFPVGKRAADKEQREKKK